MHSKLQDCKIDVIQYFTLPPLVRSDSAGLRRSPTGVPPDSTGLRQSPTRLHHTTGVWRSPVGLWRNPVELVMDTGLHTRTGLRVRVSRARVRVSIFSPVAHPHP